MKLRILSISLVVITATILINGQVGAPLYPLVNSSQNGSISGGGTINGNVTINGTETINCGTVTASTPCLTTNQTWNNAAVNFIANRFIVTDTASGASSLIFQILGGAAGTTSEFTIDKSGNATIAGNLQSNSFATINGNITTTNGFIRAGAANSTSPAGGDIVANRGGVPGSGVVFFGGSANLHYIFYDGAVFNITDPAIIVGGYGPVTKATQSTAPTATTFCTSPSIPTNNGTAAFTVNVGTSCATSVATITFPTATTSWVVNCSNVTVPATNVVSQTGGTTTTATLTNYSRTTGLAANWTDSNILRCQATGY